MSYVKDPQAVLDYAFDWSDWLAESESVISATVTMTPTGLTKPSQSIIGDRVVFWLSGGTVGATYTVTCHVTTNQGRQEDRTMKVTVRQR